MNKADLQRLSVPVRRRYRRSQVPFWMFGGPLLLAVMIGFLAVAVLNLWTRQYVFAIVSAVLFGVVLRLVITVIGSNTSVRIIPYFSGRVTEADTYLHGKALALNSRLLDEIAETASTTPLSAFGFNDDMQREQLIWHDPTNGIRTVEFLSQDVRVNRGRYVNASELQSDLARLEGALRATQKLGLQFCLLVRIGDSVSAMEMNRRRGFVHDEWKEWDPVSVPRDKK